MLSRSNDVSSVVRGSSRSSFVHKICKFVQEVDDMNDTVLVPSLLIDLKCPSSSSSSSESKVTSSSSNSPSTDLSDCFDLQTLHQLLNRLKDELTIARFDDDLNSSSANLLSSPSAINCNSPTTTITTTTNSNVNSTSSTNQIISSSSSSSSALRIIAEGDDDPHQLTGLSKKLHSCSGSSDDGFSSLNSYSRNSDDELTSSSSSASSTSPASDSESECSSEGSSSSPNHQIISRENGDNVSIEDIAADSSPEYIVNLLRLHIQGIQSILNRFSKYPHHVSDSYVNSLD